MRNIIFRGKRINRNGEWGYGDLRRYGGNTWVFPHNQDAAYDADMVDPTTVGEFTGLEDKNGKDIYEGDILKVEEYINMMSSSIFDSKEISEAYEAFTLDELKGKLVRSYVTPIVFEEGSFCISSHAADNEDYPDMFLACLYGDMKRSFPIFEFEVIGNIHDNPELLYECQR